MFLVAFRPSLVTLIYLRLPSKLAPCYIYPFSEDSTSESRLHAVTRTPLTQTCPRTARFQLPGPEHLVVKSPGAQSLKLEGSDP